MSVDHIVYCLERVSDYRDFERLCSTLLAATDYPGIDPLGGTGDGGRDAIVRQDRQGRKIVFAYTVREDWRTKLKSDCERVRQQGHQPDKLVFVCTEALSASEKDFAHRLVKDEFGWDLDLFDIERLRVQLVGPQRHLIAQHTSIFSPPFFPQSGGQSLWESKDTILIDHVDADHALATWLSRRLTLAGYRTWCRGTAPLAGESPDETVRQLMVARAQQYLPVLSDMSLSDPLFTERCALAAQHEAFVIPCDCSLTRPAQLPSRLKNVAGASFATSWREGLEAILAKLKTLGLRPALEAHQGRQIALRDYMPTRVTVARPEPIFANAYQLRLPQAMLIFDLYRSPTESEVIALRAKWAFVELNAYRLVAFTPPPDGAIPATKPKRTPEFLWADTPEKDGKRTENLAKELAWRSLEVICAAKGLVYCADRRVFYFPQRDGSDWNQPFQHVDGRSTRVQLTGTRSKTRGDTVFTFAYQLAPRFRPQRDADGSWNVVMNIYVRCTTTDGRPFELKEIGRRRKAVTKSWWNKDWLARQLGMVHALRTTDTHLELGTGDRAVAMSVAPLRWECPVGLDVHALSGIPDLGEELAEYRSRDDANEESDDAPAEATEGPQK
jgi:hypothetical protein